MNILKSKGAVIKLLLVLIVIGIVGGAIFWMETNYVISRDTAAGIFIVLLTFGAGLVSSTNTPITPKE